MREKNYTLEFQPDDNSGCNGIKDVYESGQLNKISFFES